MVTIQFEQGDLNERFLDGAEGVLVLAISNGKFDLSSKEARVIKWTHNLINQLRNAKRDEEHHAGIFTELRIDVPIMEEPPEDVGKWERIGSNPSYSPFDYGRSDSLYRCSGCGYVTEDRRKYCPECGKKMKMDG